jgi:anti-sigma factor RsiW
LADGSDQEIEVVALDGLTAGYWIEGELTYALVGPISAEQLVAIAAQLGADEPQGWL